MSKKPTTPVETGSAVADAFARAEALAAGKDTKVAKKAVAKKVAVKQPAAPVKVAVKKPVAKKPARKPVVVVDEPLLPEQIGPTLDQRVNSIEGHLIALPGRLDKALRNAVHAELCENGELIAEAIMPHAGKIFRHGAGQTALGILMTPVYIGRSVVALFKPGPGAASEAAPVPAAVPA